MIRVNVGGQVFESTRASLVESAPESLLAAAIGGSTEAADAIRLLPQDDNSFGALPPLTPAQRGALKDEATALQLQTLSQALADKERGSGCITVGYRGTFAFGRDGQADVKFRKLNRILVCGKSDLCREAFGETLNESRDADVGGETGRYTSRVFLKHNSLEMAFDSLYAIGYNMIGSAGSGASSGGITSPQTPQTGEFGGLRPGDSDELRWNHYNEFVFYRPP